MPAVGPIKRRELVACVRALGFEPWVSGGDHEYAQQTRQKTAHPQSSR